MSAINPDTFLRVMNAIEHISQGRLITKACDLARTSRSTLENCANQDGFIREMLNDALQRGYDIMAENLLEIDDANTEYGASDPRVMRVKSENIKWFLSKADSARFGEKVVIENKITVDKTIVEALSRGKERAMQAKAIVAPAIEEVAYTVVEDLIDDLAEFK